MNTTYFIARPGFVVREIADAFILVPVNTGQVYLKSDEPDNQIPSLSSMLPEFNGMIQLDHIGLFLWNQLATPKTVSELIRLVNQEFDTHGRDITKDILAFLNTGILNQIIFVLKDIS